MAKKQRIKNRIGVVYSTSDEFNYDENQTLEEKTLIPKAQKLKVGLDKKNRRGKQVTLVSGFTGMTGDIVALSKMLKTKCGVGGNVKDREILIQGNHRDKVLAILLEAGYQAKRIG